MTGAPAPRPAPPADALTTGVQFHGELSGGTAGFGGAASVGIGFNRVAILLTPTIAVTGTTSAVVSPSLDVSVRIYLKQRVAGTLVGFLRPGAGVFFATAPGGGSIGVGGTIGFGAGGEYLLTKNLGFTVELALRYSGTTAGPVTGLFGFNTIGSVGIMLHQ